MRAALLLVAACHLPHVPAEPRTESQAAGAVATITSSCAEFDQDWLIPAEPAKVATGVVVSARHVITAAHAVSCGALPDVHAEFTDGERDRMVVEKDDVAFGGGLDLARLEILSAGGIPVAVAPPVIAGRWNAPGPWCARTRRGPACGDPIRQSADTATFGAPTQAGDSGSGVYDRHGRLVGIVTAGDGVTTLVTRIPPSWTADL